MLVTIGAMPAISTFETGPWRRGEREHAAGPRCRKPLKNHTPFPRSLVNQWVMLASVPPHMDRCGVTSMPEDLERKLAPFSRPISRAAARSRMRTSTSSATRASEELRRADRKRRTAARGTPLFPCSATQARNGFGGCDEDDGVLERCSCVLSIESCGYCSVRFADHCTYFLPPPFAALSLL